MRKIIDFLELFFEEERKMNSYRGIRNIEQYNTQVTVVKDLLSSKIYDVLGAVEMRFELPNSFYSRTNADPLLEPRTLFKISKYSHPKYETVWVAYTNGAQAHKDSLFLGHAIFIIEHDDKLEIANAAMYSDYDTDGLEYKWDNIAGEEGLNFDSLGRPDEILRIKEPLEDFDGLKMYNEDM